MKKNRRSITMLALMMVLLLTFTACADGGETKKEEGGGKKKVGYVINNLNDTFQTYILEAAQKYAEENDIEISVMDSQEDTIKQQDLVNSLIEKGVDGLVVIPTDTSAMDPITEAAQKAKVPLVYVNRNPFFGKEDTMPENVFYVGSNEKSGGRMQMEYIGEQMGGKGGVAILMGILGNEGALQRTEGVKEVIAEKYPDIKVLTEESGNWQRDQGLALTENFMQTYGDELTAVIANNDEMAMGAIRALETAGKLESVKTAGLDAIPDALKAVEEGKLTCTVFQDAVGQGSTAVEILDKVTDGGGPDDSVTYIPFKLITKENVAEFK